MKAKDTPAGIFVKVEEFDHCNGCLKRLHGICAIQEILRIHKGVDIRLMVIKCRENPVEIDNSEILGRIVGGLLNEFSMDEILGALNKQGGNV